MLERASALLAENLLNTLQLRALRLVVIVGMRGVRAGIDFKGHVGVDNTGRRAYTLFSDSSALEARFGEQIIEINTDWVVATVRLLKPSSSSPPQQQDLEIQMPELGERIVLGDDLQAYQVEKTQIAPKRKTGLVWLRKL